MEDAQFALYAEVQHAHWWFSGRREIMRAIVHRLAAPSESTVVVDIGCGTGSNIGALSDEYACVGFDQSPEAIRFAEHHFPKVRFHCGSSPGISGETLGKARVVLIMDVLEHVPDDFSFLSSHLAAASPGAEFLMTVPAKMTLWNEQDVRLGHYRRYERDRLERLWQELPVTVRLLSYYNARLYPFVSVIRPLTRLTRRAWGDAGTDVSRHIGPANWVLGRVFSSEKAVLLDALDGRRRRGFARGVSLIAVLRREAGEIRPRERPDDVPPDPFDPDRGNGPHI